MLVMSKLRKYYLLELLILTNKINQLILQSLNSKNITSSDIFASTETNVLT